VTLLEASRPHLSISLSILTAILQLYNACARLKPDIYTEVICFQTGSLAQATDERNKVNTIHQPSYDRPSNHRPFCNLLSLAHHADPPGIIGPARPPCSDGTCASVTAIPRRLSSHCLSARMICTILSRRACLTSLMDTVPSLTSLSSRKSNSLKSPSSLSSAGPEGNALSSTGGEAGLPLMASASRRSVSPPHSEPPALSTMCRCCGSLELAHSIRPGSMPPV
jgi:hypothetical protein